MDHKTEAPDESVLFHTNGIMNPGSQAQCRFPLGTRTGASETERAFCASLSHHKQRALPFTNRRRLCPALGCLWCQARLSRGQVMHSVKHHAGPRTGWLRPRSRFCRGDRCPASYQLGPCSVCSTSRTEHGSKAGASGAEAGAKGRDA